MTDELYIRRCFQLAKLGAGNVSPNPMVGCVIVSDDKIIGEGYHKVYGQAHAEPNAINSVEDKELLKKSTLYVNLEPCSHHGKTPPCAELIIKSQIPKVVICNTDPNPKVAEEGIRMLKEAGIEIIIGVLEKEGRELNKRFFCYQEKKRPYIILKWAETKDGFMDIDRKESSQNYWITNDALKIWVHKQRTEEDIILVGKNTILNDNPKLNVRNYTGRNPIRMTIDKDLSIPKGKHFFDNTQQTVIFNSLKNFKERNIGYVKVDFDNLENEIIQYIYSIGKNSLVIEGGKKTIESFINKGLWDEANILIGDKCFENGLKSPKALIEDRGILEREEFFDRDKILYYYNR